MPRLLRHWLDRIQARSQDRKRQQVLDRLSYLHERARQLEAYYREDALAAAVLAPRVVPALEGLAAEVGRSVQMLARRIEELGGVPSSTLVRGARAAETMWGHLGPNLDIERDIMYLAGERPDLRQWDPTTAEVLTQVRKDAAVRERQLMDLVARL